MKYSCIIPCFNSENSIEEVVELTKEYFMNNHLGNFEIILTNDYSSDKTIEKIKSIVSKNENVVGIDLAKNSGQHNALLAAMSLAQGDYIISLDDDLQTMPDQIGKLIDKLNEGYDVVYGKYATMKQTGFRNFGAWFNDVTIRYLLKKEKGLKASSFWICKKFVKDELIKSNSNFTNIQGLFLRTTSKIVNVEIDHHSRKYGTSTYTLKKLLRLWSSCLNYSYSPLRAILVLGVITFSLTLLSLLLTLILAGFSVVKLTINVLICFLIAFFGSLILLSLGIIAEYIGRNFMINSHEPQYVIKAIYRK